MIEDSNEKTFLFKKTHITKDDKEKYMSFACAALFGFTKGVDIDFEIESELIREAFSHAKDLNSIPVLNRKPQPTKVLKKLNQIINHGEKFVENLKEFYNEGFLSAIIVDEYGEVFLSKIKDLINDDSILLNFILLSKNVRDALSTLKKEQRSARFKQDEIIKKLGDIYTELTGQKPTVTHRSDEGVGEYGGNFILFCNCVARLAFEKFWSETQLANITKRLYPPEVNSD